MYAFICSREVFKVLQELPYVSVMFFYYGANVSLVPNIFFFIYMYIYTQMSSIYTRIHSHTYFKYVSNYEPCGFYLQTCRKVRFRLG